MLVLPMFTIPAEFIFLIRVASYGAIKLSNIFEPQDVFIPLVQKISFCAMGIPVKGVASPDARCTSANFA